MQTQPTPEPEKQPDKTTDLEGVASTDLLAVFHVQHPLTGDAIPVMRTVNMRTTVADLIEWQMRNVNNPKQWQDSWVDIRILTSSR